MGWAGEITPVRVERGSYIFEVKTPAGWKPACREEWVIYLVVVDALSDKRSIVALQDDPTSRVEVAESAQEQLPCEGPSHIVGLREGDRVTLLFNPCGKCRGCQNSGLDAHQRASFHGEKEGAWLASYREIFMEQAHFAARREGIYTDQWWS